MKHEELADGRTCWAWSHFTMQCMWNAWLQDPQTGGQSSPGTLQSGQHASKGCRWEKRLLSRSSGASQVSHDPGKNTHVSADAAAIVVRIPLPRRNAMPALDLHSHVRANGYARVLVTPPPCGWVKVACAAFSDVAFPTGTPRRTLAAGGRALPQPHGTVPTLRLASTSD